MKHDDYSNLMVLFLYGELEAGQISDLKQHLSGCAECRTRLQELRELHELLEERKSEVQEHHLLQARERLFEKIRRDSWEVAPEGGGFLSRLFSGGQMTWNWAAAGGTATGLCVGLMLGYFGLSSGGGNVDFQGNLDPFNSSGMKITSVALEERDADSGKVRLSFEAARRFELEGRYDDTRIQKFLAYALINEQNAGIRLRAVNTIREQAPLETDPEIRHALIMALRHDENPAVRQQALNALQQYPPDREIKAAFIYVLAEDPNAKLRIEAINALEKAHTTGQELGQEALGVLEERLQSDSNKFIRLRAKAVLEEAKPQYF